MFQCKRNRYLQNDCEFFDTLKTEDREIRGNCNLLIKVIFRKRTGQLPPG